MRGWEGEWKWVRRVRELGGEMVRSAEERVEGEDAHGTASGILSGHEGWGEEANRWLGEEVVAGWRISGKAMYQRMASAAVRMMFSMWLTEDVQVGRMHRLAEDEKALLSKCGNSFFVTCDKRVAGPHRRLAQP